MFFIWTVPGPSTGELITLRENIIRRTGVRKRVGAKYMEILVRERGRKHRGVIHRVSGVQVWNEGNSVEARL